MPPSISIIFTVSEHQEEVEGGREGGREGVAYVRTDSREA